MFEYITTNIRSTDRENTFISTDNQIEHLLIFHMDLRLHYAHQPASESTTASNHHSASKKDIPID